MKLTALYLTITETDGEYAIIDEGEGYSWNRNPSLIDRGKVWAPAGGGYWRFVQDGRPGTLANQVCEGFAGTGSTLHGPGAPERTANRVYKTRKGFEAAIARLSNK